MLQGASPVGSRGVPGNNGAHVQVEPRRVHTRVLHRPPRVQVHPQRPSRPSHPRMVQLPRGVGQGSPRGPGGGSRLRPPAPLDRPHVRVPAGGRRGVQVEECVPDPGGQPHRPQQQRCCPALPLLPPQAGPGDLCPFSPPRVADLPGPEYCRCGGEL